MKTLILIGVTSISSIAILFIALVAYRKSRERAFLMLVLSSVADLCNTAVFFGFTEVPMGQAAFFIYNLVSMFLSLASETLLLIAVYLFARRFDVFPLRAGTLSKDQT
jgi:hypothetical protein